MKSLEAAGHGHGPVLEFLARLDRRLRLSDVVNAFGRGLWGLPIALVLSWAMGRYAILITYGLGMAGFLAWTYLRLPETERLSRSATVADRKADLKDALKSSLAFLGLPERSVWMDFQIGRTAAIAETLDAPEMAPSTLPRSAYYAAGAALAVGGLMFLGPRFLPESAGSAFWPFGGSDEPETMAEILDESAPPEAAALEPEIPEVEETLSRLRERDLDLSESLADLKEAQDALAASRLDMEQLQMDLERMGAELENVPSLSDLAAALENEDAQKAAELLRQLAERLQQAPNSEELQALLEALQNAGVQQADMNELMQSLENMQSGEPQDMAQMMEALQQAANQLESLGQQQAMQQPLDPMEGQQSLQASMGEQQQGSQQQQGGQQQQQAGGQATQASAGMMSQMQMAQMQGDPSNAVPVDAGPAGEATGPGGSSEDQVLGDATTLDVQLEMEILKTEEREEPVPEETFERLSREEKSTLNYESIAERGSYADESALSRETVPWPYRSLVKRYFLTLVSRAEAKSESGAQK